MSQLSSHKLTHACKGQNSFIRIYLIFTMEKSLIRSRLNSKIFHPMFSQPGSHLSPGTVVASLRLFLLLIPNAYQSFGSCLRSLFLPVLQACLSANQCVPACQLPWSYDFGFSGLKVQEK